MATQQEILSWLAANPQATDRDIAAAMNQYGVSTGDLAGATGWDAGAVNDRYGVANAQNYIDTQWSDPLMQLPGNVDQRNWGILGATQGMGLTDDQQARAMGWTPEQVTGYEQQYAPQISAYQGIYGADVANPAPYMQPVQPTATGLPASNLPAMPNLAAPTPATATMQNPAYGAGGAVYAGPNAGTPANGGGYNPMINDLSQHGGAGASPYALGGPAAQGMFGQQFGGYQASPWLSATADEIGRRTQQGLGQAFNSIRSNSIRNGTLGGSRQGVAEGIATRGAMDSLQGQLAGLYGSDWTNAQNRYLTGRGQDISNYNTNRSLDMQQLGLGANIYDMGVRGGWQPLQTANGIFNTTAGNNVTQTSGGTQGGGWQGLLGGAMGAGQYARNMGWW
jgi:hypothetical protein